VSCVNPGSGYDDDVDDVRLGKSDTHSDWRKCTESCHIIIISHYSVFGSTV
jgi:hypothetical protein